MYEVATREMPERSLLCLKRNVAVQAQWAFGKEFIAILRERSFPRIEGREGAFFCIYWSHPTADGDGLIEWCKPVPQAEARALAEQYPELTLRTEPAHHLSRDRTRHQPGLRHRPRHPVRRRAMIEGHGLVKRYGSTMAVTDLSFSVRPGLVTGFLGQNGAGKTSTSSTPTASTGSGP